MNRHGPREVRITREQYELAGARFVALVRALRKIPKATEWPHRRPGNGNNSGQTEQNHRPD